MRLLSIAGTLLILAVAGNAMAQEDARRQADRPGQDNSWQATTTGQIQPTPEMWFYEQYRQRYDTPEAKVEQNAAFRADQRQSRLASRRWFGLSNARPAANTDPINGDYSAGWASNNSRYPMRWTGWGNGWIVPRAAD